MSSVPGLKITKGEVSQTLDLKKLFGVSFEGDPELRLAIAQRVIDYIRDRTANEGRDIWGRDFKEYSEEYEETTVFKLLKDSKEPNLTLTGNMLASIDVLGEGPNTVRIGFDSELETLKAFNHNTGDTVTKREFFGITDRQAKELIGKEFGDEIKKLKGQNPAATTVADILKAGSLLVQANDDAKGLLILFNTVTDLYD